MIDTVEAERRGRIVGHREPLPSTRPPFAVVLVDGIASPDEPPLPAPFAVAPAVAGAIAMPVARVVHRTRDRRNGDR